MHVIRFWLLGAFWPQVIALSNPLPHVEQYEVVWPQHLPRHRARRAVPSQRGLYPEKVSYILGTGNHTFTLHLRKNRDLLGSGYTETYSADNGSEVTEQLHGQDHCLYQGHVEGHQGSAASLSTCSGLRGFFRVGSAIHLIEPLDGSGEEGRHAMYQAEHLQQKVGTCGVSDTDEDNVLEPRALAAFWPHHRKSPLPQKTHFVELYVVTDSKELQLFGSREAVRRRVLEVVNHVDKLYQKLNFRVVLVGLEIWSTDKIYISHHANVTLDNFLSWRARALTGRLTHDNVQLITGIDFSGPTVGLAKVSALCSWHSGAVNQDHSQNPIGVASTMAHELGHNLGMSHDEAIQGCYCSMPQESGGCIMAASLGSKFPRIFSRCSQADLETFLEKPEVDCLANAPDLDRLVGGPVCGNLFVERGEQCDCGTPQDCRNPCCNATTCQLAEGAKCAHGECCHECKVKPAGELCRQAKDGCDMEEFCDGQQPMCPEDAFQENGTPCPGGYCFDGNCPTMAHRCRDLWGLGAQPATDTCFKASLSPGCSGTVSFDKHSPNRCGVLYCTGGQKPRERSSCTFNSHRGLCQALQVDSNIAAYELVLEGTKCDEGKVCWKGQCQDLQIYRSKNCSAKCHNRGVCNHKSECHCHTGWAPPHCAELLVDVYKESGSLPNGVLVVLVLLAVGVVIVAGVIIHCKMWRHVQKRSSTTKTTMGLSNPLFHEGGTSLPAKGKTPGPPELISTIQPSQFPKPTVTPKRPPPAPPATMSSPPLPLPVYTQQASDQLRPAPPTKPLPKLKPKQVVKPSCALPVPPVKPWAEGITPGRTQGLDGTKVALKPPVLRR
ncbi:disintegrin and metalloproteinase domain-containing protein 8 [Fukomys damarensis]|uniref:disintegrin and metalloproteinase domain-containing protein 8 n=1 Tax=Fukomys damarensis TaxID=885580 RepID=UPI0005401A00|nr:disintegrin and metalloproteinase domain-containing protein 8 [Fukomys damarensis]